MSKSAIQVSKPAAAHFTDEDAHSAEILSTMQRMLLKRAPDAKIFSAQLFARASYEDISAYLPEDLAGFAEDAWRHLQKRKTGAISLRIENAPQNRITVVEVINDNMPFLVDSVMAALTELGHDIRLVLHPIFNVSRDKSGKLTGLYGNQPPPFGTKVTRESFIHIHIEAIDSTSAEILRRELQRTLADVGLVVADWKPMLARLDKVIEQFRTAPPPIPSAELSEAVHFLEWLRNNNFTFLGLREYKVVSKGAKLSVDPIDETGFGLMRDPSFGLLRRGPKPVTMTEELRHFLNQTNPLIITKANARSRVHRRIHIDYVGVKLFDTKGNLTGELRLAGLFTSTAYTSSVRVIPYLSRKMETALKRSGLDADSHSGKALINIIENYPRDELFQIDDDLLLNFAEKLLQLEERPRIRLLVRNDKFDRFVSIMVYVPRDRYTSGTRAKIGDMLAAAYKGRVAAWNSAYPEGPLARLHFIIAKNEKQDVEPSRRELERHVTALVRTWEDEFMHALLERHQNGQSKSLKERYLRAFPPSYQDLYTPRTGVEDIATIEKLSREHPLSIAFYPLEDGAPYELGLKLYHCGTPLSLSRRVPILEAIGFNVISETSVEIRPDASEDNLVILHDLRLAAKDEIAYDFMGAARRMEEAFLAIWSDTAENDGYNALVLLAGLTWQEVSALRAMSRYLRQIRIPYSQDYMWETLSKNPGIATALFDLFRTRFDLALKLGAKQRQQKQDEIIGAIEESLRKVASLDEDRILRRFLNLISAMIRTNFYQRDKNGALPPALSFKFDARKVEGLPEPRPLFEIFVFGPRVEGVHLRMGRIARGGLRWSDRPQDFRTEILGLVKAQQVKNAVIVPVGAKGGFVPKKLPAGPRDAIQEEGIAAYKIFVNALLGLTDNLDAKGGIVHPEQVLRHDKDDPYLVVAADKGTATFSDIANEISVAKDFWLGDAFASGGSAGYDHKAMGITARGAWEAVKRHFREMDVDIQATPFTCVGVGDMSGDVFGNAMLLSKQTRLVAAFDHRDIFIDPDPDPAISFKERQRLFKLARSSWADYDARLISKGGGVFSRALKSIPLSPQMQALTGLKDKAAAPQAIMNALLKADVDLLWFGGIGTYVRATQESDEQAGDRANDALRITGAEIRARVVGEGANLGMTQRARIEAAQKGVRLNTDAIDNCAGVTTSDFEVNIKIALSGPTRSGKLSMQARNQLLQKMTDEVARLVLGINYSQTLSLSLSALRGAEDAGFAERLMQLIEQRGRLSRKIEYLPDTLEVEAREQRGEGLTRPEIAVLTSYAKLVLHDDILDSPLPDDPYFESMLKSYFPSAMQERLEREIAGHRLRRNIIATVLSNAMIDRGGATILPRAMDQTGATAQDAAASFAVTSHVFGLENIFHALAALDNKISGKLQLQLYKDVQDLLHDRIAWFLRHGQLSKSLAETAAHYAQKTAQLAAQLDRILPKGERQRFERRQADLLEAGVPKELGFQLAALPVLIDAPDIILAAEKTRAPLPTAAKAFYEAGELFNLADMYASAKTLNVKTYYERLALDRAVSDLSVANRRLAIHILKAGGIEAWKKERGAAWQRARNTLIELSGSGLTVPKLTVAAGQLWDVAGI